MEQDDTLERLQKRLVGKISNLRYPAPGDPIYMKDLTPRCYTKNGGMVSVQASEHHHSMPRENEGPYTHVEVGYPKGLTGVAELLGEWSEEEPEKVERGESDWTVFGYVPIERVVMLLQMNGGLKD